jgi:hypothetical protein
MDKKKVGRPVEPDGITHTGVKFTLWFSKLDYAVLARVAKREQANKAEVIRRLIRAKGDVA